MDNDVKAKILDAYLRSFKGRKFAREIVKTSEDIAADISPMVEIDINMLSEMMLARGYELTQTAAGVVGWVVYNPQMLDNQLNPPPSTNCVTQ